eukprot:Skav228105  [mRNA]  locus=scaffold4074:157860:165241:+ [translate_table: standard]
MSPRTRPTWWSSAQASLAWPAPCVSMTTALHCAAWCWKRAATWAAAPPAAARIGCTDNTKRFNLQADGALNGWDSGSGGECWIYVDGKLRGPPQVYEEPNRTVLTAYFGGQRANEELLCLSDEDPARARSMRGAHPRDLAADVGDFHQAAGGLASAAGQKRRETMGQRDFGNSGLAIWEGAALHERCPTGSRGFEK